MFSPTPHRESDHALVSLSYWSVVESVLRDRGVNEAWMNDHPGLTEARHIGRLRCKDYESLLLHALQVYGQELGLETGLRGYPTKHGPLGLALMSSATLADAMALGMRYHRIRMPYYDIQLQQQGDWIWVDVHDRITVDGLQHFGKTSALVEMVTLIRTLSHIPQDWLALHFTMPEPAYFSRYQDRLPPCTFNWSVDRLAIRADALGVKLPSANAEAWREACRQCDTELVRLGLAGNWRERVIANLQTGELAPKTIDQMAQHLHVSARTLKRHLQAEGCTFKGLQDGTRQRLAQSLLADLNLPISDIAQQVGFDDPAHFTRAFKRWMGETPSQVRTRLSA